MPQGSPRGPQGSDRDDQKAYPTQKHYSIRGRWNDGVIPKSAHNGLDRHDVVGVLGAFLGDFGGSFSLHELCKRVLGALRASNLALSCSFEPSETLFWSSGKRFGEKFRVKSV